MATPILMATEYRYQYPTWCGRQDLNLHGVTTRA